MSRERGLRPGVLAFACLVALVPAARWLADRRPGLVDLVAGQTILVTSPRDDGPGSLRSAIFAAASADHAVELRIAVPRIVLKTPLPPIVNPHGVLVDGTARRTVIDARAAGAGPVLELQSKGSLVTRITIKSAAGSGLLLRGEATRVRDVDLEGSSIGIAVDAGKLRIEGSRFRRNGIGLKVLNAQGVVVVSSEFEEQVDAAVWSVEPAPTSGSPVTVRRCRFTGDRVGVVLVNVAGEIEDNVFRDSRDMAIYLTGSGYTVMRNRATGGEGSGFVLHQTDSARVEANELDGFRGAAILVRQGQGNALRMNRLFRNGFGIASILAAGRPDVVSDNVLLQHHQDALFTIGSSPVLEGNRALTSGQAGARILDYVPRQGPSVPSRPLLRGNTFSGNRTDEPVHGSYVEPEPPEDER